MMASSSSSISTIISNYYYHYNHNSTTTNNNSVVFSANSRLPTPKINLIGTTTTTPIPTRFRLTVVVGALKDSKTTDPPPSAEEDITKKYGLEAGLWKIFSSSGSSSSEEGEAKEKGKGEKAKELLTKYGGAYLATSITLSLISFSLCYALISAGIDVSALLTKVGITSNDTGEKLGTFALAYAAHKAASPIRFPPTVALTPIVASWINKNKNTT